MNKKTKATLAFISFIHTSTLLAACRTDNNRPLPFTPNPVITSSNPVIDPSLANGSTLARISIRYTHPYHSGISCTGSWGWQDMAGNGTYSGNYLYATNIPGISYRLPSRRDASSASMPSSVYVPDRGGFYALSESSYIELVKSGTISRGGQISGLGWTERLRNWSLLIGRFNIPAFNVTLLTKPTCRLNNTSIPINFGVVPTTAANGLLVQRDLNVPVTCSGGSAGTQTSVYMTLTDANNPANRSNNLTVIPTNAGMTININHDGWPMYFGPASSAAGNPGQKFLRSSGNGTINHYFVARLMRTGPMRGLPSFSARATMTMRYE